VVYWCITWVRLPVFLPCAIAFSLNFTLPVFADTKQLNLTVNSHSYLSTGDPEMISLLQQYKRSLIWFISGLVLAVVMSLAISHEQPATAYQSNVNNVPTISEFAASHLEPNFYQ